MLEWVAFGTAAVVLVFFGAMFVVFVIGVGVAFWELITDQRAAIQARRRAKMLRRVKR